MSFDFGIGRLGTPGELQTPNRASLLMAPISQCGRLLRLSDSQALHTLAKISYGRLTPWTFWGRCFGPKRRLPSLRRGWGSLSYAV
jgi:hypothetical protein